MLKTAMTIAPQHLCRAKDTHGNWVYGFFFVTENGSHIRSVTKEATGLCFTDHKIQPSTLGRYTGINDKNDNPVFEHDIVQGFYDDLFPKNKSICRIEWVLTEEGAGWGWAQDYRDAEWLCPEDLHELNEVIGNVFDHPHLVNMDFAEE